VNGLLHRLLGNGEAGAVPGAFQSEFAPYHPLVYYATTISSLLLLALAFQPWDWKRRSYGVVDLITILAAATMASPVAWNHHYGMFLPMFAVLLPLMIRWPPLAWATGAMFGVSFLMISFEFDRVYWFLENRWRLVLISHLFLGAILLLVMLIRLRGTIARTESTDLPALLRP
jgi:hypothetical protein